MRNLLIWSFLVLFSAFSLSAQEGRNVSEYNLSNTGVGVLDFRTNNNFDPVSFFPEGGGSAQVGSSDFSLTHKQVTYHFSSQENLETFKTNPSKYEPTYGGWCARAMVVGQKVQINAKLYTIAGDRIFFFVNSRAKRYFDRDVAGNAVKADENWKRISGESPRL